MISILSFSCSTPDADEGEINKLRPDVNKNANINVDPNANVAEDNESALEGLINLPFEPEENMYREDQPDNAVNQNRVADPNNRRLTAVLKFTDEDTTSLVNKLEEVGKGFESKIESEPWFPAELIAKSQTSGDESIKGTGYKSDIFLKPPFTKGSLLRVNETNYFVLVVHTK